MQQNVYGVGYDLSVLLAVLGVGLDGDPISGKLSIGCDASSRTTSPGLPGPELGLDGHNKFEGDTSLTRNDYFLGTLRGVLCPHCVIGPFANKQPRQRRQLLLQPDQVQAYVRCLQG